MVQLEAEPAGILTLRLGPPYAEDDEPAYLAALEAIGGHERPFALLAIFGGRGRLSPAGERAQALWFKATRRQLDRRCRALAIVRPGDPGGSASVFGRLWAFPVAVRETEVEGRAFLAGLYVAQAIPSYLLAAAVPPIMREAGVSRSAIGYFSILFLPLVLKFLWAPWVDRVRPFARAHRAGWVVLTQFGVVDCILALTAVSPNEVTAVLAIGFTAALFVSTQDIATDGYAAKYLAPEDRGLGNAIQGGSIAFGVLVGGTLGLVLHHRFGWQTMLLTIAAISLLPLLAALGMREGPPVVPATRPSLRAFLRRPEARGILWVALTYRASEGLVKAMEGPYLVDAGVPLDMIGFISGASAATAGVAGSALAAWLVRRAGLSRTLGLLGGLRTLCFLLFTLHAAGLLFGYWPLYGAAAFQTLIRYMEIVALYSLFMSVTSSDQPGTDFTTLACAQLVVYLIGSLVSGRIADALGYPALFGIAAALSGGAVLASLALLRRVEAALLSPYRAGMRPGTLGQR